MAKFQSRAYSCALIDRENCERSNGSETTLSALPISLRAAGWYSFHASANSRRGCYRNLSGRKGKHGEMNSKGIVDEEEKKDSRPACIAPMEKGIPSRCRVRRNSRLTGVAAELECNSNYGTIGGWV